MDFFPGKIDKICYDNQVNLYHFRVSQNRHDTEVPLELKSLWRIMHVLHAKSGYSVVFCGQ